MPEVEGSNPSGGQLIILFFLRQFLINTVLNKYGAMNVIHALNDSLRMRTQIYSTVDLESNNIFLR